MNVNLIDPSRLNTNYKRHPLSAVYGDLPADELKALAESIDKMGMQYDIHLYDGMIIDGWNRYQACKMVNYPPFFRELNMPEDALVDWVAARNVHRRHLTAEDRAEAVLKCVTMLKHGTNRFEAKKVESPDGLSTKSAPVVTIKQAAKMAKVGVNTMKRAKAKLEKSVEPQADPKPAPKPAPKPKAGPGVELQAEWEKGATAFRKLVIKYVKAGGDAHPVINALADLVG